MSKKVKIKQDVLIEELKNYMGIVAPICEAYGITRQALWHRIKKYPILQEALAEGRSILKDKAETALSDAVENKERWAIETVINKLCHDRGYVDKKEIDQTHRFDNEARQEINNRFDKILGDGECAGDESVLTSARVVEDGKAESSSTKRGLEALG